MNRGEKLVLFEAARKLIGIPEDQVSGEAAIAIHCAIDMGFRTPVGVAGMAKTIMSPPTVNPPRPGG